jgi:hypothetical protein
MRISEQRLKKLIGRFNAFQKSCAQTHRNIYYSGLKIRQNWAIKYLPHLPIKMFPWQKFFNQDELDACSCKRSPDA